MDGKINGLMKFVRFVSLVMVFWSLFWVLGGMICDIMLLIVGLLIFLIDLISMIM